MKISELMTKEVLVIQESIKVDRMLELFSKHEITGAPVIDSEGGLVGVVSLTDLSRPMTHKDGAQSEFYLNPSWGTIRNQGEAQGDWKVSDIMTHLIISAEDNEDISVAADHMVNYGIHRVLVTREKKVVGWITSSDLVREFRTRLHREAAAQSAQ